MGSGLAGSDDLTGEDSAADFYSDQRESSVLVWHNRCFCPCMKNSTDLEIHHKIYFIRGHRVMLDSDLAALIRAVRRNVDRFPSDFMFLLSTEEVESLRCQIGISKTQGRRYLQLISLSLPSNRRKIGFKER